MDASTPRPTSLENDTDPDSRPWYIGDDDLFIHPHWWKYKISDIPSWHFYLIGLFIGVVGIIGVTGNGLVILTYFKERSLRTPPNMFIMNLAVSDLVFSAVNGFPLFTVASIQKRWNWGMKACQLYALIGSIFGFISIYINAAIAIDRYFVIVQPIQSMRRMTKARAGVIIVIIWVLCLVIALLPIGGIGGYIPEGFQTSCSFDYLSQDSATRYYNIGIYVFSFLVPLIVIIGCYYQIVKAVAAHEREMTKMSEKLGKDMRSGNNIRSDIKTAKVSAIIIFFWFMTWSPYAFVCFFGVLGITDHLTPYVSEIPVLFAKTSAMYNPIIYAVSHPKFRNGMQKTVPFLLVFCPGDKKGIKRGTESGGSRTSQSSDCGSAMQNDIPMKEAKSTDTINTVAGEVDKAARVAAYHKQLA